MRITCACLQKELMQWVRASEEKEEEYRALATLQHQEDLKMKELSNELERWGDQYLVISCR